MASRCIDKVRKAIQNSAKKRHRSGCIEPFYTNIFREPFATNVIGAITRLLGLRYNSLKNLAYTESYKVRRVERLLELHVNL